MAKISVKISCADMLICAFRHVKISANRHASGDIFPGSFCRKTTRQCGKLVYFIWMTRDAESFVETGKATRDDLIADVVAGGWVFQ